MENFGSWSVLTTNFLFILYLALGGVTFSAILHLVNGKWRFKVRNLACSLSVQFPIAGVLLLVLLANGHTTFTWLAEPHDAAAGHGGEGEHRPGWLNYSFLVAREVAAFLFIWWLYRLFIKYLAASEVDPIRRSAASATSRCSSPSRMCCTRQWWPGTSRCRSSPVGTAPATASITSRATSTCSSASSPCCCSS